MCCRYYLESSNPELLSMAEAAENTPLMQRFRGSLARGLSRSGEVAPSMIVPVVATNRNGERACFPMQWGYHLQGKNLLANARAETAAEKPMFRDSWRSHRCLVPASWYYEWEHFMRPNGRRETGERYLLQPKGSRITWLCGLYRLEEGLPRFVILTRAPGEEISFLHDRMPLIVSDQDAVLWIDPQQRPEEIAFRARTDLFYQKTGS